MHMTGEVMIKSRLTNVMGRWQEKKGERLTIRKLADKTGINKDFLSRLDRGEVRLLNLEKLAILCEFFGVTPNDLLWEPEGQSDKAGSPILSAN